MKMKSLKINTINNPIILLFFFILFIFLTNAYYSYAESLIYGGSDGFFYIKISESFPRIAENIEYIKGERFFFPYLLGGVSKLFSAEIFHTYRIFVFLLSGLIIFFLYKSLKKIKSSNFLITISISFLIFNPYILRYYLAIPTIITDLFFILSAIIIAYGFINKNKKYIFIGFAISILARQNGLFFFISFLISKFYFQQKSFFNYKDIFALVVILFTTTLFTQNYAILANSETQENVKDLYIVTLFGLFKGDYTYSQFISFILFPLLSFMPLLLFFLFQIKNLKKFILTELMLIILITSALIFAIAFVSGPVITGKNIIRLLNLSYPMLIIAINLFLKKGTTISKGNLLIIIILFALWSFHPTFSNIVIFNNLKFLFNL